MHMLKDTGLIFQLPKILCLNPWDWVTHISKHPITWGTSKTQICLPAANSRRVGFWTWYWTTRAARAQVYNA